MRLAQAGTGPLVHDDAQRPVERAEHTVEFLPAPQDVAGRRDHAVGALPPRQPRILLDAIDGELARAAENRKDRTVVQEIDGVIAPFAGGDLTAIKTQNTMKLAAAEGHFACGGGRTGLAPAPRARFDFAEFHTAPPLSLRFHACVMIAPDGSAGPQRQGRRRME